MPKLHRPRSWDRHQRAKKREVRERFDRGDYLISQFYRSKEWRQAKEIHLKHQPVCVICGSDDRRTVDHIKPIRIHPDLRLDLQNYQTLCFYHHQQKRQEERALYNQEMAPPAKFNEQAIDEIY